MKTTDHVTCIPLQYCVHISVQSGRKADVALVSSVTCVYYSWFFLYRRLINTVNAESCQRIGMLEREHLQDNIRRLEA